MEELKTINGYNIYIGGSWCEVTDSQGGFIFDGTIEKNLTHEQVFNSLLKNNYIEELNIINIADIKIKLTGEIKNLTHEVIEKLKTAAEPIYWNDSTCKHFIMDFKIYNVWFESVKINNELTKIHFNVFV